MEKTQKNIEKLERATEKWNMVEDGIGRRIEFSAVVIVIESLVYTM